MIHEKIFFGLALFTVGFAVGRFYMTYKYERYIEIQISKLDELKHLHDRWSKEKEERKWLKDL